MGLVYAILAWLIGSALILMLTRRCWWEWDPSEPRFLPAPSRKPARTPDHLARQLHLHDQEEAEARHA